MSNLLFEFKKMLIAYHVDKTSHIYKCGTEHKQPEEQTTAQIEDMELKLLSFLLGTFHDAIMSTKASIHMIKNGVDQVTMDVYGKCKEESNEAVKDWIARIQKVYLENPPDTNDVKVKITPISQEAAKNAKACEVPEPNITNNPPPNWED